MWYTLRLLFNTIRFLKPVQVWGRVWFRLHKPTPDLSPAPAVRKVPGVWTPPVLKPDSLLSPTRFRFLNEEHACNSAGDWNHPDYPKLWLYNLHYFDCLNSGCDRCAVHDTALMDRWVDENPPGLGNGWEPYTLSLRLVNWIKWHLAGHELSHKQRHSLAVQVRFLRKRLEYHLLGNHLLANAKALIFAGLFFDGREADRWLAKGLSIYRKELPEQVLADGGHFERSPMYHAVVLDDLLDVFNLFRAYNVERSARSCELPGLPAYIGKMLGWLEVMVHPDRQIPLFKDAAFGIAPTLDELKAYAARLGLRADDAGWYAGFHLSQSGYVRLRQGGADLVADVGDVGPDYQPGHAHADTLSFELSLGQQRVFVDSGTSCYGRGTERLRQRQTASHNTVTVDGVDSSEVWGGHRVARRARVHDVRVDAETGVVSARHDGYRRLKGVGDHCRRWTLTESKLEVTDRVGGRGVRHLAVAFHLHPDVTAVPVGDGKVRLSLADRPLGVLELADELTVEVQSTTYHPEFGRSLVSQRIVGKVKAALPQEFKSVFSFDVSEESGRGGPV